jgi:adenosylcobinamide-GDP ribazoletransferase
MASLPYVTANDGAKSRDLTRAGVAQAAVASVWFVVGALAIVLTGHSNAARVGGLALALGLVTALSGWRYWVRVGGITGDFLGATEQLCELAALAVLAW